MSAIEGSGLLVRADEKKCRYDTRSVIPSQRHQYYRQSDGRHFYMARSESKSLYCLEGMPSGNQLASPQASTRDRERKRAACKDLHRVALHCVPLTRPNTEHFHDLF